ncbi:MAG: DUF929 domain-containing protein [Thaumarchaeota archaeon]|nr:DUF929 domain-containing protein [Nitrososphaerota archaeon]
MGRRATLNAKKRNRRIVTISIVAAIIAAIVVLILIVEASQPPPSPFIGQAVSSTIMQQLTGVSDSTLKSVGLPTAVTAPTAISGTALTLNGKPEVLYIGGEFCPFCAIERWSMIIALSHFGNFSGLEYMQSSSTDTNPNTPTFTFAGNASVPFNFTSKYVAFVPVEEWDRSDAIRQTPTTSQQALYTQYGSCASTSQVGIPFIDVANSYVVNCGAQFSLPQIAGDNWTQVASQLNTPSSAVAQGMDGAANSLITAICKVDGEQPTSVCSQSYATVTLAAVSAGAVSGQQNLALLPQVREESRWTS